MKRNNGKPGIFKYKKYKNIYVRATQTYYCCDFYLDEQGPNKASYKVIVEVPDKSKSEHLFSFNTSLQSWDCTKATDLPNELIKELLAQIEELLLA